MRLVTWNINSIRQRLHLLRQLDDEYNPDVVCFQETKAQNTDFPMEDVKALGFPHVYIVGMKGYNGVAICSKLPLENETQKDWVGKSDCRHQSVTLPNGIEVHNFYVPAGGDEPNPETNEKFIRSLEMAEEFFSLLTTMEARFIQANPDGSYLEGDMYMHRPGRMRFEYDDPVPILLVADGTFFIHVDKQLKQVMHIPLGSTPANFMLSEDLSIKDGLNLIGYERVNGILRMQFEQTEEPELGSMILTFTDDPMMLKQWTIIDAQQNRTTVTIIAPRFGDELDPDLFYFVNPWTRGRGDR